MTTTTTASDDEWKDVPPILYHYCNAEGLRGIIENKCLWMSSVSSMNDYMEHNWLIEAARAKLMPRLRHPVLDSSPPDVFYTRLRQRLCEQPPATHYVVGFSSDGDVLSQWRAYASDGAGFAVGFNPRLFGIRPVMPSLRPSPDDPDIGLSRIFYQDGKLLETLDFWVTHCHDKACSSFVSDAADRCYDNILQFALTTKNPAFKEEQEWRIIWLPSGNPAANSGDAELSSMKFRVRQGRVIPYYELRCRLTPHDVMPIREIVLGPKNPHRDGINAIEQLLAANGHNLANIKVWASKATYR